MYRYWVKILALSTLVASLMLGSTAPGYAASVLNEVTSTVQFRANDSTTFFQFTYNAILERTIVAIDAHQMTVNALKGLVVQEPSLVVNDGPSVFELRLGGYSIMSTTPPDRLDTAAWATLTTSAIVRLRDTSTAIGTMDNEAIYDSMMVGLLTSFDPFSRYSGAAEAARRRDARVGYGGIGIHYDLAADHLTVTEVLAGTPAETAGLQVGDTILALDGLKIVDITGGREAINRHLRGVINSTLRVLVQRPDATHEFSLKRAVITPHTVALEPNTDDGIAVIHLSGFNQSTVASLIAAISEVKRTFSTHLRGVILDLRGNPGGLLDQSIETVDLFLDHGTILQTEGRAQQSTQAYAAEIHPYIAKSGDITDGVPVVVLIDGGSASASEIVAAALQDNERAVVVGSTSYGKGTVQVVLRLPNGGELALTWSRFHTPSGYTLQGLGVLPTVCLAGANEPPAAALSHAMSPEAVSHAVSWREVAVSDVVGRENLRQFCPPRDETTWQSAVDAGRRLIDDPDQYRRALSPTAVQTTSH